jgi:acetyl-CoA carboxylase biotin carboxyl carrier protein
LSEKKQKPKANKAGNGGGGKSSSGAAAGPMNVDFLQQLVDLMASNDLNTVDLRDSDRRIVLKRGQPQIVTAAPTGPAYAPAPASYSASASQAPASAGGGGAAGGGGEDAGLVPIKSPMVGTFYAASSPDAKPFVTVGSAVDEETDVCIIEAMKVFNNIKAETRGTIAKILVTSGQTVEFGTVLFLVKPS